MILNIAIGIFAIMLAVLGGIVSSIAPRGRLIKLCYIGAFAVLGVASVVLIVLQARITQRDQEAATFRQERLQASLDETRLDAAKATSFLSGQVATLAELIAHPPPNQDLRKIAQEIRDAGFGAQRSNVEWKRLASELTDRLRKFQTKIRQESDRVIYAEQEKTADATRKGNKDEAGRMFAEFSAELANLSTRQRNEFGPLRVEALEMRTQLLARLPPQKDDQLSQAARMVLDYGALAGPNPVGDLADYLERLAAQLSGKSIK